MAILEEQKAGNIWELIRSNQQCGRDTALIINDTKKVVKTNLSGCTALQIGSIRGIIEEGLSTASEDLQRLERRLAELQNGERKVTNDEVALSSVFVTMACACPWISLIPLGLAAALKGAQMVSKTICHIKNVEATQDLIALARQRLTVTQEVIATINQAYDKRLRLEEGRSLTQRSNSLFGSVGLAARECGNCCDKMGDCFKGVILMMLLGVGTLFLIKFIENFQSNELNNDQPFFKLGL